MKQILLFDRAMLVRMRIKEALASSFVKIIEVENELEMNNALQKYKNEIDLLIMDVASDSSDGFEMVRRIKENEPNLQIVILTASNKRADFIRGVQAGAVDYILKPFDDGFFRSRIISVLDTDRSARKPVVPQKSAEDKLNELMDVKPGSKPERQPIDFHSGSHEQKSAESHSVDALIPAEDPGFDELLKAEKYKARKGKYPLTIFALVFDQQNQETLPFSERHFADIRAQLWESDEFVHYGPYSFFGILPFCHEPGFERFKEKMDVYLNQEAEERDYYQKYHWHVIGVTVPYEANEKLKTEQVIDQLKTKIKDELEDFNKNQEE